MKFKKHQKEFEERLVTAALYRKKERWDETETRDIMSRDERERESEKDVIPTTKTEIVTLLKPRHKV